jgi:signal transduction histidine kinase
VGEDDLATETGRRRRFLGALNWGWLGVGVLALVSLPFYRHQSLLLSVILAATLSTFLAVRLLTRLGRDRSAGALFILLVDFAVFAMFLVQADQMGLGLALATRAPTLMMMGLAVLFAGALVGPKAPFLVALLNSLLLGALAWMAGHEPRFTIHVFWWLLALVVWLYERTLLDAFEGLSSARRDLQILVDRRTEELRQTVTRLSDALGELENSNRELDAFTSAVSHDLRAPVRSVIGFSDALYEEHAGELSLPGMEYLSRVRNAARRMHALIDNLLRLSRVSRPEMHREQVDIAAVARGIVEELRRSQPERQVEYRAPEHLRVLADARLIEVLLENLLGNAWKFTRRSAAARVELGEMVLGGERVCFVGDNGVGFDMTYAEKLFRPFQRLHSSDEFDGTGIGLATAQRVVNRHGGRIWAEGKVDEGATFFFTLQPFRTGVERSG